MTRYSVRALFCYVYRDAVPLRLTEHSLINYKKKEEKNDRSAYEHSLGSNTNRCVSIDLYTFAKYYYNGRYLFRIRSR